MKTERGFTLHRYGAGFTLIELLVAISILAILSTVGLVSFQNVREKTLESKRKADLDAIKKAYEQNFDPSLNGGQGGYKPLTNDNFASGKIPTPDGTNNTSYVVVGPDPLAIQPNTTGSGAVASGPNYAACINLSDGSRCATPDPDNCYCVSSTGGTALTPDTQSACDAYGILTNGLVGYWKMDENSDVSVADSSGRDNNGTWNGTGSHWVSGVPKPGFQSGGNFNGTNDWINLGSKASLNSIADAITVSAWVKTSVNTGTQIIIGRANDWRLRKQSNAYGFEHRNSDQQIVTPVSTNTSTNWVQVAGTYDSSKGQARLYINGALVDSKAQTGSTRVLQIQNQIGNSYAWHGGGLVYNDYWWNGQIDDIRIYNRALSDSEISLLYNNGDGCF